MIKISWKQIFFSTASHSIPQCISPLWLIFWAFESVFPLWLWSSRRFWFVSKMAYRNDLWREDESLQQDLAKYSRQGMQRDEMLSFFSNDYSQYAWSLRTLDRRLREFCLYHTDKNVSLEALRTAVTEELDGPGKLLGYGAMANKLRQKHHLKVPRRLVHNMLYDVDPEGLAPRALDQRNKARVKGKFTTRGPNWVHSLDGHAKLMGFQKSTFPLAIYGCIDTASRKLLFWKLALVTLNHEW